MTVKMVGGVLVELSEEEQALYDQKQQEAPKKAVKKKLLVVEDDLRKDVERLTEGYGPTEVQSWVKQESEARGYPSKPTPILNALSAARGEPVGDLVDKVLKKAEEFALLYGEAVGRAQARRKALEGIDLTAEDALAQISGV